VLSDEFGLTTDEPPTVNTRDRQLVFRDLPTGDLYWQLPDKFAGNKVGYAAAIWKTRSVRNGAHGALAFSPPKIG